MSYTKVIAIDVKIEDIGRKGDIHIASVGFTFHRDYEVFGHSIGHHHSGPAAFIKQGSYKRYKGLYELVLDNECNNDAIDMIVGTDLLYDSQKKIVDCMNHYDFNYDDATCCFCGCKIEKGIEYFVKGNSNWLCVQCIRHIRSDENLYH
jgi:hypothetical protein